MLPNGYLRSCKITLKANENRCKNGRGKIWSPISQWQKIHPIIWDTRTRQNASKCIRFHCSRFGFDRGESAEISSNHVKWSRILAKIYSTKYTPRSSNRRIDISSIFQNFDDFRWPNPKNDSVSKRLASWKRSKRCAKAMKYMKIHENRRKSSMSTLQKSTKNHVLSMSM